MKIAYLISAHKDPTQLGRMIVALDQKGTQFYIHLDKKVDINVFKCQLPPPILQKLTFTDKRFYVQWGGFSQVMFQQELLRCCIESGMEFDRVIILTAQDYPLWSNEEISRDLVANPSKEYVRGLNISMLSNVPKLRDKLTLYHFFRDMEGVPYKLKQIFSGSSRIIMRLLPIRKKPYLMINGKHWDIYQASAYMCITWDLAHYVYKQLTDNRTLIKYFRTAFAPDEMVIPTIIFNSSFASKAELYPENIYPGLKNLSAITYFNYDKSIQVFTENDYDELKASGRMFARKMETGTSDRLMDRLDYEHGIKKTK